MTSTTRRPLVALAVASGVAALALTGCVPEPDASASPSATSTTATASTPATVSPGGSATPSSSATASADDIALPSSCEALYSSGMLATLNAQNPPLNDPGVTMYATQNAAALEVLNAGEPTLRCSWGVPSEKGLATNVTIVDAGQAQSVRSALEATGFTCADDAEGTLCTFEKQQVDLDDNLVTTGESHFFRGNGWISTAYVDYLPDGYTEDIAQNLWR